MTNEKASRLLKEGKAKKISRKGWLREDGKIRITISIQNPDENSFMTESYFYMEKLEDNNKFKRFPIFLSAESLFTDDWFVVF